MRMGPLRWWLCFKFCRPLFKQCVRKFIVCLRSCGLFLDYHQNISRGDRHRWRASISAVIRAGTHPYSDNRIRPVIIGLCKAVSGVLCPKGTGVLPGGSPDNAGCCISADVRPDIIGEFDVGHAELIYTSGAFSLIAKERSNYGVDKDQTRKIVKFMASSGNSIYGTFNNVNVPSAYVLIIIKQ